MRGVLPGATVVVGVLAASSLSLPASNAADTEAVIKPVSAQLRVAMSEAISEGALTRIQDALFEAPARPRYLTSRVGTGLARGRLADAAADGKFTAAEERVAISGTPFTAAETAQLAAGGIGVERMPVHAVAPAFIMAGPGRTPDGFQTDRLSPDGFTELGPEELLDGPSAEVGANTFKMPWANLANIFLETSTPEKYFGEPGLMNLWGFEYDATVERFRRPGSDYYLTVKDSFPKLTSMFEPDALNYWLQEAFRVAEPDVWSAYFQSVGRAVPATSSESYLGINRQAWRSRGIGELLRHLSDPQMQLRGSSTDNYVDVSATMVAAPLWALPAFNDTYPRAESKRWVVQVRNGAEEWVLPTSASISAAIAAGGEEPLYALKNAVPGAYPLAWVESLYAPDKGLTIDETNILAALVRLLVTDGQDIVKADRDGVITAAIRNRALEALTRTVTSNCETAGGVVVSVAESPYLPPASVAPKMNALGAQAWCATKVPITPTTTTTTTIATTTTTVATTTSSSTTTTVATTATTAARTVGAQGGTTRTTARPAGTTPTTAPPPTTTAVTPTAEPTTTTTTVPVPTTVEPPPPAADTEVLAVQPVRRVLPLGIPESQVGGFNRLTTMALGGLAVLWLRRAFARRRRLA